MTWPTCSTASDTQHAVQKARAHALAFLWVMSRVSEVCRVRQQAGSYEFAVIL